MRLNYFARVSLGIVWAELMLCMAYSSVSADVGQWKNYTNMRGVVSVAGTGNALWAATHGGLFLFNPTDSSFTTFTNSEGLTDNDLTAVLVDNSGEVWAGASNGAIDVYDPPSETWQHIVDVLLSDKTLKGITGFYQIGDSIFVSSEFGVSLFLVSRFEFKETYAKFGSFPSSIRTNAFVSANGRFWAATASGLASADRNSPNLSAPSAWTTYTTADGLPSNGVNAVVFFNGTIYAGTDAGLSRFRNPGWEGVAPLASRQITHLVRVSDRLCIAAGNELYSLGQDGITTKIGETLPAAINALLGDQSGNVALGVEEYGLAFLKGSGWSFKSPNGPASNSFVGLKVDSSGVLFAASGANNGEGFYKFDASAPPGKQWVNYNLGTNPELGTNDYYRVSLGQNNSKWISSWGRGVARLDGKGDISVFNKATAGITGIPEDTNFVVIGDVAPDLRGNTWMTVRSAANRNVIAILRSDSKWFFMQNGLNRDATLLTSMAIDLFNTKWIVSGDPIVSGPQPGLLYLNDGETLTNTNDDVWGIVTADDGLTSNTITRLLVDRDGEVWVGTNTGLNVIVNPRSPKAQNAIRRVFIAYQEYINDLAIDPIGNKWVGTKDGVFVLSSDGTALLAQYTVENTGGKLIDNDVRAVAFDEPRGIAYFGTGKGLSSLTTDATAPRASFDQLRICPQLLHVPVEVGIGDAGRSDCGGEKTGVLISGLVENTSLRVFSIDGRLVRQIETLGGGRGRWDGKDNYGNDVSSGVYLIVAYSQDGAEVALGKVAVLRK